jgi:O-antigen/teichoic acid export membrane protein
LGEDIRHIYRSIRTLVRRIISSPNFQASGIYLFTSAINAAIPFLLLPVLTRYLSPTDYGIVAMFQVLVGIVSAFVGLSVHGAIARQYYERDTFDFSNYITNCLYILLGSSLLVGLALLVLANPINTFTAFPKEWLWAVLVTAATNFFILIVATLWQVRVMPMHYGAYQIALVVFNAGLSIWFVVGLEAGWQGRLWGQLLACVIFAVLGSIILKRGGFLKWKYQPKYVRHALGFGAPLLLHDVGTWAIYMTDRIMIVSMIGLAEAGIYTVAAQVGMVMYLIQDSINRAWVPWFYSQLKKNDFKIKLKIVKITYLYNILILSFAFFFGLIAPWLFSFFVGKDFKAASSYVIWIAVAYAFNGMYKMATNYCFYAQDTRVLPFITFSAAAINIGASYLLIKLNGAIGAAQAKVITYFIFFITTWFLASMVYKMPWRLRQL